MPTGSCSAISRVLPATSIDQSAFLLSSPCNEYSRLAIPFPPISVLDRFGQSAALDANALESTSLSYLYSSPPVFRPFLSSSFHFTIHTNLA